MGTTQSSYLHIVFNIVSHFSTYPSWSCYALLLRALNYILLKAALSFPKLSS